MDKIAKSNIIPESCGNQAVDFEVGRRAVWHSEDYSVYWYVASTLNLEQVDLTSVQCLMKKTERHLMVLPITTLVWLWRSNMHTYAEF